MRILVAADMVPDPNSGAAGTDLQTIAALRKQGHEVDEIWEGDLPHRIKHWNMHYILELPWAYRRVIRERLRMRRYDVIQVNQAHCFLAAREHREQMRSGIFICRSHGVEDCAEEQMRPWRKLLGVPGRRGWRRVPGYLVDWSIAHHTRLAAQSVDGFVVSCTQDREFLRATHGVSLSRCAVIPQVANESYLASEMPAFSEGRLRRLLYVANFGFRKGVSIVASVMNTLSEDTPDVHLTWVCNGSDHDAARGLLASRAQGRVQFLPWRPQEELMKVFDDHGIFLFPSFFEGFGKVFCEAMARGLCVIGTPTGGMRDWIVDGQNGFLAGFNEPMTMVERVKQLWSDPALAKRISAAGAQLARTYTWDRVAGETVAFFEQILYAKGRTKH